LLLKIRVSTQPGELHPDLLREMLATFVGQLMGAEVDARRELPPTATAQPGQP
jgi:hypothetical protein